MNYNDFGGWVAAVVALFNSVLSACMAFAPLRFFLVVALFLAVVAFFAWLVRRGSRQRL